MSGSGQTWTLLRVGAEFALPGSADADGRRALWKSADNLFRGNAMKLPPRQLLHLAAGAATLCIVSSVAWAQTYPTRPITMIVPFPAGGATDIIARIVAEPMSRALGQPVVIENIGGAGGTTGSVRLMRANPDGYTIGVGHMGTHATAVALYPNLAYRPETDFAPMGVMIWGPVAIVARKDFPARDFREFVAYVKANDRKLNFTHAGVGSISFSCGLFFNSIIGARPTSIPFNGLAAAMNACSAAKLITCATGESPIPCLTWGVARSSPMRSDRSLAVQRSRTCRPQRKQGCRSST